MKNMDGVGRVAYDAGNLKISVEGLDDVARALGTVSRKTPAAAKVAINATARQARKLMIARAKARYAVNAAGQRHLKDLVQKKKATNSSLLAELRISSFRNDLAYFKSSPKRAYPGRQAFSAPEYFKGHVLKDTSMEPLTGTAGLSKGFLAEFKSGHVGMVQRVLGSNSKNKNTFRSGAPRWRTKAGRVEKLQTMGSPSATAMHNTIWPEVEPEVTAYLQERLRQQVQKLVTAAEKKKG